VDLKRVSAMVSSAKMAYGQKKIFYFEGTKNKEINSLSTLNGTVITYKNTLTTT
jgi:hypothetical protein